MVMVFAMVQPVMSARVLRIGLARFAINVIEGFPAVTLPDQAATFAPRSGIQKMAQLCVQLTAVQRMRSGDVVLKAPAFLLGNANVRLLTLARTVLAVLDQIMHGHSIPIAHTVSPVSVATAMGYASREVSVDAL